MLYYTNINIIILITIIVIIIIFYLYKSSLMVIIELEFVETKLEKISNRMGFFF